MSKNQTALIFTRIGPNFHIIQPNGDARLVGLPFAQKQFEAATAGGGGYVIGDSKRFFQHGHTAVDTLIIYGGHDA